MIKITIEVWPKGNPERKYSKGIIEIWNDRSGTRSTGNYKAVLYTSGEKPRVWKTTEVKGFPRTQMLAYDLLFRVLKNVVGDRNL